jgi:hypothetical protein
MEVARGTALMGGIPGYILGSVATLAALLDVSVIARRGLAGRQRIARRLWRMLLGFFVAAGSFFPGQIHLFPELIQKRPAGRSPVPTGVFDHRHHVPLVDPRLVHALVENVKRMIRGRGYSAAASCSALRRSTDTSCETPRSIIVTP